MASETAKPDVQITTDAQGNVHMRVSNLSPEQRTKIRQAMESTVGPPKVVMAPPCDDGIIVIWQECGLHGRRSG